MTPETKQKPTEAVYTALEYAPCNEAADAWVKADERKHQADMLLQQAETLAAAAHAAERLRWKAWQDARRTFHARLGNPTPSDLKGA